MIEKKFATVVVEIPINYGFDYFLPENLRDKVDVGSRVWVPFGRKTVTGYVVSFSDKASYKKTKAIIDTVEDYPLLNKNIIKLADFIADYYLCPIGLVFKCILPKAVRKVIRREKYVYYVELLKTRKELDFYIEIAPAKAIRQKEVIILLKGYNKGQWISAENLFSEKIDQSVLKALEKKEIIVVHKEKFKFDDADEYIQSKPLKLTKEQKNAYDGIVSLADSKKFGAALLYGVTGSGKTEVYLQAIDYVINQGRQAIVIVPEISLTPQTIERFKARFGQMVAVLHSRLSDGERYYNWKRIKTGDAKIVVGPRSAVFAPFSDLGIIVVDEEHERCYKQEDSPKYHARDVSVIRAKYEKAVCVLGSATPAMESYYNALKEKYLLFNLSARVENSKMPSINVVDMREEVKQNAKTGFFSRKLLEKLSDRIEKAEQSIIFLNKRGYARILMCVDCGHVFECKACSISLTYHKKAGRLLCHMCGYSIGIPGICPECRSTMLKFSGFGTQKIEAALNAVFPDASVGRMDADTTSKKGAHQKILDRFRTGKIDILIGTQMIAKGLDFPNVTLVGIVSADSTLHIPDFRAGENTFQLLTQVAGRAGRGEIPGEVVIQTFTPEHPVIELAVQNDYIEFYNNEIEERKILKYPPFAKCINVTITGEDERFTADTANKLAGLLSGHVKDFIKLGPVPAPVEKVKNKFRWHILLKGKSIVVMRKRLQLSLEALTAKEIKHVIVDIDPQMMS